MSGGAPGWRRLAVFTFMTGLAAFAIKNVLAYRDVMADRLTRAQRLAALSADTDTERVARHNFYALLGKLGNMPALHEGGRFGVFVTDSEFFKGAYIDRPVDTTLTACAIQPFSIPAFTGMPLLSGLLSRDNGCHYDSYGYQYLPHDEMLSSEALAQPCVLARRRGMRQVVVIDRHDVDFAARRIDCDEH
ncbi:MULTISPECIES: hypothetical protein [Cupriavidus]